MTQSTIARCLGCLYELDFAQIENDVSRHGKAPEGWKFSLSRSALTYSPRLDKGNYSKAIGINFRLRFLQKSHIAAKRVDDVQYGCVFCVQQGFTLDKSDATVFFNQKALFDHLARHPRPLPEVPGLTVIEGERVPDRHHNDYDIHFKRQPLPHPVFERANEIAPLPCGIAKEQARRLYGQRLLYDRSPALELAQGARITGISWPVQYQGEWMLGWHNGNYASIPSDIVKLEVPARSEIKYDRTSLVRAKARWKFHMKEKDKDKNEWLKFDKNETISNIACE